MAFRDLVDRYAMGDDVLVITSILGLLGGELTAVVAIAVDTTGGILLLTLVLALLLSLDLTLALELLLSEENDEFDGLGSDCKFALLCCCCCCCCCCSCCS